MDNHSDCVCAQGAGETGDDPQSHTLISHPPGVQPLKSTCAVASTGPPAGGASHPEERTCNLPVRGSSSQAHEVPQRPALEAYPALCWFTEQDICLLADTPQKWYRPPDVILPLENWPHPLLHVTGVSTPHALQHTAGPECHLLTDTQTVLIPSGQSPIPPSPGVVQACTISVSSLPTDTEETPSGGITRHCYLLEPNKTRV